MGTFEIYMYEKTVISICMIPLIIFIFVSPSFFGVDQIKDYTLAFNTNGDTTFENSNFMVTVDNHNERSKLLHIYGLTKTPVLANISSTYLSYQKGRISQNITFDHDASKLTNVKFESDNLLDPK